MNEEQYDRLDRNLERLGAIATLNNVNRVSLLLSHAVIAVVIGTWWNLNGEVGGYIFGPPESIGTTWVPESLFAAVGLMGGIFLLAGIVLRRNTIVELWGLRIIFIFDVMVSVLTGGSSILSFRLT